MDTNDYSAKDIIVLSGPRGREVRAPCCPSTARTAPLLPAGRRLKTRPPRSEPVPSASCAWETCCLHAAACGPPARNTKRAPKKRARGIGCFQSSWVAPIWPWGSLTEPCRRWRPRKLSTPKCPGRISLPGRRSLAKGDASAAVTPLLASLAANPFDPSVHCSLAEAYKKLSADTATTSKRQRAERDCRALSK